MAYRAVIRQVGVEGAVSVYVDADDIYDVQKWAFDEACASDGMTEIRVLTEYYDIPDDLIEVRL